MNALTLGRRNSLPAEDSSTQNLMLAGFKLLDNEMDRETAIHESITQSTKSLEYPDVKKYVASLKSHPALCFFGAEQLEEIIESSFFCKSPATSTMWKSNDMASCFFVIESGSVSIKDGPITITSYHEGDCFGVTEL